MEISKKHPPFLHYLIISRTLACIPLHALKGQKLLAQGSALGKYGRKSVAL